MRLGCVVMAAGNGARFGKNKLLAPFRGRPLLAWALDAVPPGLETVVVTQYPEVTALAEERGYSILRNDRPDLGVSHTIRLGTEALAGCDGIVYLVGDQPLLRRETVCRLLRAFETHPEHIVVPRAEGREGNPCVFPAACFPDLRTLTGDRGGKAIIRRQPERVFYVEVPGTELLDVDTAEEWAALSSAPEA